MRSCIAIIAIIICIVIEIHFSSVVKIFLAYCAVLADRFFALDSMRPVFSIMLLSLCFAFL